MLQGIRKRLNLKTRKYNFQWGLRPFLVFLTMLGFRLDFYCRGISVPFSFVLICLLLLHTVVSLIFNVIRVSHSQTGLGFGTHGDAAYFVNVSKKFFGPDMGVPLSHIVVQNAVQWFSVVVCPMAIKSIFTIHIFLTSKCKELWGNVLKIQEELNLTSEFFKKCRTRCYLAFLLFLLVCNLFLSDISNIR